MEFAINTSDGVKVPDVMATQNKQLIHDIKNEYYASTDICPEICMAILSQGSTSTELEEKKVLYFEAGAKEVWHCTLEGELSFFSSAGKADVSVLAPQVSLKTCGTS